MKPDPAPTISAWLEAVRKALRAARQNLPATLALEAAMAGLVAIYYGWPAGASFLTRFAGWEREGGILAAAVGTALAGGLLSELAVIYFQNAGRWTVGNVENAAFKMGMFFISGAVVYEFYRQQAVWFGDDNNWSVLVRKVLVDQLGYTPIFAVPYMALLTRWQTLRYSPLLLWQELDRSFIAERMLPVLVTNWMLWVPGVTLVYAMPQILQTPLFIFATAIWGILLSSVAGQPQYRSTGTLRDLVVPARKIEPGVPPSLLSSE